MKPCREHKWHWHTRLQNPKWDEKTQKVFYDEEILVCDYCGTFKIINKKGKTLKHIIPEREKELRKAVNGGN